MKNNDSERLSPRAKKILRQIKKGIYVYPIEKLDETIDDYKIVNEFFNKNYIYFKTNSGDEKIVINGIKPYYINFKILDDGNALLSEINSERLKFIISIATVLIALIGLLIAK